MVFFDRSWYNRAVVEPVNKFCSMKEYKVFMNQVNDFERMLLESDIILIKIFLAISKEEQAKRIAEIDGLTQIPNRRTFDETLARYWEQLGETQQPLAAILCDIDFFKKYNDTYGHQQGDSCLISIAQSLYNSLPDETGLAARYGGEEFIFLLPNTEFATAAQVAEQARANIEQLNIEHRDSNVADHVTLSLGVACIIPSNASSAKQLIEAADCALYASKETGRNRVSCAAE
jgi:diguanylate cyclase (GGDEF)-like protein